MASTYTTGFGIEKIGSGEQDGTWGTTTNHNLDILDRIASYKAVAITTNADTATLTVREASPGSGTENLQDGMYRVIKFTGALDSDCTVTIAPNTAPAWFIIENATTDSGSGGPYSVILSQGSGANVTVQNGKNAIVYCDGAGSGAAVVDALADLQVGTLEVTGAAAIDGALTGSSTIQGTTITATTAFVPDASDGAALGTTSLEFSDLYLADEAVIGFGDDQDVTLTHVADTGLLLNSTMALQFNDATQYINAPSATVLDINATDEIELNATLADVNANLDVSGTYTGGGLMTTGGNIVIPDAGNIGSASDTNAISISSGGVVAVTATTANTSASDGALTVAGGVGVAADLSVGDDLRLISDAAVLNFGADSDVNLTHVADTGLLLNSTMQLQFNDATQYINAPSATVLDINATDEIELNATLVDVNANLDVSGTVTTDDATDSTSGTSGSIQTDGGIGAVKDIVTDATFKPLGDTAASDAAAIGYTAAEGLILTGQGSTSDITLKNDLAGTVFTVPSGTDDILFPDGAKAMWGGTTGDLQIYHSGSNSNITDAGTGDLYLRASNDIFLTNVAGSAIYARFNENGAVTLYQNGNPKFFTTSGGVEVTGEMEADSLDIDGASQLDGALTVGVDGTGYDVTFHGDTASAYMKWDTSADDLILGGAATLHIEGDNTGGTASSAADSLVVERSTTVGMTLMTDNSGVARIMFADAAANNSGQIQYSHVSDFMSFNTAAAEAMRIDSSGLLGLGTAAPTEEIHVFATAPTIRLEDSQNNLSGYINGDNGNILLQTYNANRDIIFGENATSGELMRIKGTGLVNIGGRAVTATNFGGKNLIINGGFQVNQRVYVSTAATADGTYMHDRWRSGTANSSYAFSTASPASPQSVTIAANDSIEQVIEGANIGVAGTHTISWEGTATARGVVNTQTMSGNFAVSPITVTAVLNQVITLQFTGANAEDGSTIATDTGTLGKVQCEVGAVATEFEHRPYQHELALCQRYYCKSYNQGTAPGASGGNNGALQQVGVVTGANDGVNFNFVYPVIMRSAPTVAFYSPNTGTASLIRNIDGGTEIAGNITATGDRQTILQNTDATVVGQRYAVQFTADAEL